MKKFSKIDYLNVFLIIAFFFIIFLIITRNNNLIYGSTIDYINQHYLIPEYFRNLFYETKDIFPSFAQNLGMGQNIFNFSYYGLFSPIILISYLLPFIKMIDYIMITSILIVIVSIVLFYKWISNHFENKLIRFITTFMFMTAAPLIMHTHRHIMFINYMPFLIMGLFGVENYIKNNKKTLLMISIILIILTSYFFSIPALFTLFIYGIFLYLKNNKHIKTKEFIISHLKLAIYFIIPILMTCFLLFPTLNAILSSRFNSGTHLSILSTLIPNSSFENILYSNYSIGLSAILVLGLINSLISKEKHYKFLGIVLLLITFIPIINYALNGFMYLNAKVFIPFIPLAILLIGKFLNSLINKEVELKLLGILYVIIGILGCINYKLNYIFIIDSIVLLIVIFLTIKTKKNNLLLILLAVNITICLVISLNDNLGEKSVIENQYNKENTSLIKTAQEKDQTIYRISDTSNENNNTNNIRNIKQYKTSMYSSSSNKYYKNFYWNEIKNENPNRNDAIFSDSSNLLFNIYTGTKYYISKENPQEGYKSIKQKNKTYLYQNNDVFSIGYSNNKLMSQKDYKKLEYPYNVEALLNYTIIDKNVKSNYKTTIKQIPIIKDKYNFTLKEKTKYQIKTKKIYKNKIILIRFDMDYNEKCEVGDAYIKINNIKNKLTCKEWKYHNKNYSFEYTISSDKPINKLDIEIEKGKYKISKIKVYEMDYNKIKNIKRNHNEFIINKESTKGDTIKGKINVEKDGYFSLSIPYDQGFTIKTDGKKQKYEKVNTSFIGFNIEKGTHNIEINYTAPLLKIGKIVSLIGTLLFIPVVIGDIKRSKKK